MRYAQRGAGGRAFDGFRTVFHARAAKLTARCWDRPGHASSA
ncbi:hypothetical protein [Streptomyces parvulus]